MLEVYAQEHLRQLRVGSARTREEYARDLGLFTAWAKVNNFGERLEAITQADLERFMAELRRADGKEYAIRTRNRILSVVKGYFKYLVKRRLIAAIDDPAGPIPAERVPFRNPVFLQLDEGSALLVTVKERFTRSDETPSSFQRFLQARDMAMLAVLLGTGIRLDELHRLDLETWEEVARGGDLTVVGKGNKERTIPPSDEAIEIVRRYLAERPRVPSDGHGSPLLVSKLRRRLSRRQVAERLEEIVAEAKAAGMIPRAKKVTPHKLRATWVTQLLLSGANIREVQEMAGHEDLSTTMIYAGVDTTRFKETIKKHQVRYL